MEVNVVRLSDRRVADKEETSSECEEEIREWEWSMNEVNALFIHVRVPNDPMEKMEEEWTNEGDEVNIISLSETVPVDVMVRRGDVSDR